jgi:formate hydrogenlyase subunit 6/NADH:ubiquinone oxidoreductase subunit I
LQLVLGVTFLVPAVLVALALILASSSHLWNLRRQRLKAKAEERAEAGRAILIHSINEDRCVGCDACIAVCPTDVLENLANKAKVVRFGDCIQCEQCMWACPTRALVMHKDDEEPPPIKVPSLDPYYQTDMKGMYLIGEVSGKPLVRNAANAGRAVVEHMWKQGLRPEPPASAAAVDVLIVGSGPGGLSAALTCVQRGLTHVIIEKDQVIASTIAHYPKGKDVMVEPYTVKNLSYLPVWDSKKEDLLAA